MKKFPFSELFKSISSTNEAFSNLKSLLEDDTLSGTKALMFINIVVDALKKYGEVSETWKKENDWENGTVSFVSKGYDSGRCDQELFSGQERLSCMFKEPCGYSFKIFFKLSLDDEDIFGIEFFLSLGYKDLGFIKVDDYYENDNFSQIVKILLYILKDSELSLPGSSQVNLSAKKALDYFHESDPKAWKKFDEWLFERCHSEVIRDFYT